MLLKAVIPIVIRSAFDYVLADYKPDIDDDFNVWALERFAKPSRFLGDHITNKLLHRVPAAPAPPHAPVS